MGIERFFSSIQQNKITNLKTSFTKVLEHKLVGTHLYIDFNSIIYITLNKVVQDLNYLQYRIVTNRYQDDKRCLKIIKEYYIGDRLNVNKLTPQGLHKAYSGDGLDGVIISKVLEYILNIATNYLDPQKLKLIYIAIDGVPHKAKMVEQKNRRYMGAIIKLVHNNIYKKYQSTLSPDRQTYEKYKISWDRVNITPGTPFLHKMGEALYSSKFEVKLKTHCTNLEKYIYSGPYEPGEGEKKLVDHARAIKLKGGKLVIYSPDSDVTLLGLILNFDIDPSNQIQILRHDQQKDRYDVIDVDQLADNLYSYVVKTLGKGGVDRSKVVDDIVFLLTVFGNDFVPRLESFSAKNDFTTIIDKYIKVLDQNKGQYLIDYSKKLGRKVINPKLFLDVIHELQLDEGGNLQKVYMYNHYQNYYQLKKVMVGDGDNLVTALNSFLDQLRRFNDQVKSGGGGGGGGGGGKLSINNLDFDKDFLSKLKRLTRLDQHSRDLSDERFIRAYVDYFKKHRKLPRVLVTLRRRRQSIEDKMHQDKLNRSLDYMGPGVKVTKYDREMYQFNNMLDGYQKRLRAYQLNLGYVEVDHHSYTWKSDKIVEGVTKYYSEFFGIDNLSIKVPKMAKLVGEYVTGLVWVFEYYYNGFDINTNRSYGDSWFYPYQSSPLLTQIYTYLKAHLNKDNKANSNYLDYLDYFQTIRKGLLKNRVPREKFFNCLEQLMYVSPAPLIKPQIPKEYWTFADNSKYYPDLNKAANDIISGNSNIIDCRRMIFLNKCHVTLGKPYKDYSQDQQFINSLRKIKLGHESRARTGEVVDNRSNVKVFTYGEAVTLDKVKSQRGGGDSGDSSSGNQYYKQYLGYKRKYLDTGDPKYKQLYKRYKRRLFSTV